MEPRGAAGLKRQGALILVLSRKVNDFVQIGADIQVFVIKVDRGKVRLGIKAPGGVVILRGPELVDYDGNPRADAQEEKPPGGETEK